MPSPEITLALLVSGPDGSSDDGGRDHNGNCRPKDHALGGHVRIQFFVAFLIFLPD